MTVRRKEIPFPKEDSESKILLSKVRCFSSPVLSGASRRSFVQKIEGQREVAAVSRRIDARTPSAGQGPVLCQLEQVHALRRAARQGRPDAGRKARLVSERFGLSECGRLTVMASRSLCSTPVNLQPLARCLL